MAISSPSSAKAPTSCRDSAAHPLVQQRVCAEHFHRRYHASQPDAGRHAIQSPYGVIGLKLAAGGRYVIFSSLANDLVADDTNGSQDVFVRDLQTGITGESACEPMARETEFFGNGKATCRSISRPTVDS